MIVLFVITAALAAAVAGAVVGRWLVFRELGPDIFRKAAASAQRANNAATTAENIAAEWPGVVARLEKLDPEVIRFISRTQAAELEAARTAARQAELEQLIAGNFGISLRPRSTTTTEV